MTRAAVNWHGVRAFVKWDKRRMTAEVVPDEDDLAECPAAAVDLFWDRARRWAADLVRRRPGWKVNGVRPDGPAADEDPGGL